MRRHIYRGYVIDTDNLGRPYIYNTASPYSEDSDHILVSIDSKRQYTQIKAIIDARIETGRPYSGAAIAPHTGKIVVM